MVVAISSSNGGSLCLCFWRRASENESETCGDVNRILNESVSGNRSESLSFWLNVVNRISRVVANEVKATSKQTMSYVHSCFSFSME